MDFQPQGLFEKAASGLRMSRRALKSDLMRFKAYIEMRDEATGAWRGRIEEGEVVETPGGEREAQEPEAEERERPEGREREDLEEKAERQLVDTDEAPEAEEEPEAEAEEEPEAEAEEEPEAEGEPEAEAEEEPEAEAEEEPRRDVTAPQAAGRHHDPPPEVGGNHAMAMQPATSGSPVERPGAGTLSDVLSTILDKGLVIDVYARVSLVGIELLRADVRVVVASVDTYLRFAEAVNRVELSTSEPAGLPELMEDLEQSGSKKKAKGVLEAASEKVDDLFKSDEDEEPEEARPRRRERGRSGS
jgi:hypothetical protein